MTNETLRTVAALGIVAFLCIKLAKELLPEPKADIINAISAIVAFLFMATGVISTVALTFITFNELI